MSNETVVSEINESLEAAIRDIDDADTAIETASNELDNIRSNVDDAISRLDEIEEGEDKQVQFLERDIELLKTKLGKAELIITRLQDSMDEINTITTDELSGSY